MGINANHINIYWHTVISLYDSFYKIESVFYEEQSLTICVPIMNFRKNREGWSLIKYPWSECHFTGTHDYYNSLILICKLVIRLFINVGKIYSSAEFQKEWPSGSFNHQH